MSQKSPENLHELLVVKSKALYDVEQQLTKALPKMIEAAHDPELKKAFQDHLSETEGHVAKMEQVLEMLEIAKTPEISDAIRGLVSDAEWCIENIKEPAALDAALIASAQYVEHFEMAGYGTASEWAKTMGHSEIQNILDEISDEEKAANEKLNLLATTRINEAANTMQATKAESEKGFMGKLQTNE
jgi:ferritin-like metal-binding protein YciE